LPGAEKFEKVQPQIAVRARLHQVDLAPAQGAARVQEHLLAPPFYNMLAGQDTTDRPAGSDGATSVSVTATPVSVSLPEFVTRNS